MPTAPGAVRALSSRAAVPAADRDTPVFHMNNYGQAMLAGDAISRLDFLSVLRVTGSDAQSWLQGQLTADVSAVVAARSRLAAWCSPKGRVIAVFRVMADAEDGYRLVCERWLTASHLARLRMFVLRSDVRIQDLGDALNIVGVAGTRALPEAARGWSKTARVDDAAAFDELTITRVPGQHRRFLVLGPPARIGRLAPPSAHGSVRPVSPDAWRLADICAGIPRVTSDTSDAYLPQMLNLDRLRAVSFEKGCYVGQEIVARTHHLGRVKRRMYLGRSSSASVGDPIVDTARDGAPKVGDVAAAEPHPDWGYAACVVLGMAAAHSPALRVGSTEGPSMEISLPDYLGATA